MSEISAEEKRLLKTLGAKGVVVDTGGDSQEAKKIAATGFEAKLKAERERLERNRGLQLRMGRKVEVESKEERLRKEKEAQARLKAQKDAEIASVRRQAKLMAVAQNEEEMLKQMRAKKEREMREKRERKEKDKIIAERKREEEELHREFLAAREKYDAHLKNKFENDPSAQSVKNYISDLAEKCGKFDDGATWAFLLIKHCYTTIESLNEITMDQWTAMSLPPFAFHALRNKIRTGEASAYHPSSTVSLPETSESEAVKEARALAEARAKSETEAEAALKSVKAPSAADEDKKLTEAELKEIARLEGKGGRIKIAADHAERKRLEKLWAEEENEKKAKAGK